MLANSRINAAATIATTQPIAVKTEPAVAGSVAIFASHCRSPGRLVMVCAIAATSPATRVLQCVRVTSSCAPRLFGCRVTAVGSVACDAGVVLEEAAGAGAE